MDMYEDALGSAARENDRRGARTVRYSRTEITRKNAPQSVSDQTNNKCNNSNTIKNRANETI